jgi:hypothetical protein
MKDLLTVIYYTSNRENEAFESKIKAKLLEVIGDLPLISVSQKPIDFGTNICVGDVGTSDHNIYRQLQKGVLMAKTKYVCTAEADCLYPPTGYFDFNPPDENAAYHYTNVWILYKGSGVFRKKAFSLCALFSNREYLIARLNRIIGKLPEWSTKKTHPLFHKYQGWTPYKNELPVINIKTHDGMRWYTGTENVVATELPHFGTAKKLEEKLWDK